MNEELRRKIVNSMDERGGLIVDDLEMIYQQGRADRDKELAEHNVFYSNRPIEDIVLEAVESERERIVRELEEAKDLVPVNRILDDIINDKPKELGMLIAFNRAIEIVNSKE